MNNKFPEVTAASCETLSLNNRVSCSLLNCHIYYYYSCTVHKGGKQGRHKVAQRLGRRPVVSLKGLLDEVDHACVFSLSLSLSPGAFQAFDTDGDGTIRLSVMEWLQLTMYA
ncbi:Calpain-3 [Liparis tanakae]|uniref:Calpain-3 n=1 Tax=Liparis tanakae TaxID=230148 RepID=A0A4Z2GD66_9TELE|nr:Calpain-3 [Liparis tanakae]